jgi:hypothetical protein
MAYIGVSPSNGVRQKHTYTATSGTSIVLPSPGATVNDIVEIITYDVFSVADTVSKADGGQFDGNVTMAGTLDVTGDLTVDTSTLYVDSANNNIGIGTTSPTAFANYTTVAINGTTGSIIDLQHGGTINSRVVGESAGLLIDGVGSRFIKFHTNSTERMRIDSSGNLLVGTTNSIPGAGNTVVGASIYNDGRIFLSKSGNTVASFNRNTSDGSIAEFRKDGTTVGSIGSIAGNSIYAGSGDVAVRFSTVNDAIYPATTGGNNRDNATDLGLSNVRFKDLYLSGKLTNDGTGGISIDTSGKVGISTSSPANTLHIIGNTATPSLRLGSTSLTYYWDIGRENLTTGDFIFSQSIAGSVSERMRIDSSGNLLVGKTTVAGGSAVIGVDIRPVGLLNLSRDGANLAYFNRQTSDGDIITFRKDGTTVGSIGSEGGDSLYIVNGDTGLKFAGGGDAIIPVSAAGAARDNGITLGSSGARIKDIYLSGGIYMQGSTTAVQFDDYEEGTWTPAYSTSGGSFSYDGATEGIYTKIGNVVSVSFRIYTTNATIGSGNVSIAGLPFTPTSTHKGAGSIGDTRLFAGDHPSTLSIQANGVVLPYYRTSANGSNLALQASDLQSGSGTYNLIDGQITYQTS